MGIFSGGANGEDDIYGEGRSYCRACDKYHYADGMCGYHAQQVKKIVHRGEKEAGFLHDEEYQEEKRRFWSR